MTSFALSSCGPPNVFSHTTLPSEANASSQACLA